MSGERIPRIVRCALCEHFRPAAAPGTWFCALHGHKAGRRDGCTWGAERPDEGLDAAANLSQM